MMNRLRYSLISVNPHFIRIFLTNTRLVILHGSHPPCQKVGKMDLMLWMRFGQHHKSVKNGTKMPIFHVQFTYLSTELSKFGQKSEEIRKKSLNSFILVSQH